VWAGVRGKQQVEAQELGADAVVALDDDAEVAALPELDCIADTVGGEPVKKLLSKVKRGGTLGSVTGEPPGAKERGLSVHAMLTHPDSKRLGELARAVAEGRLRLPIAKKLPLAAAAEAHRLAEKGGLGGKLVLVGAS
jgi:NADPH:quinone reductase-like Zn-dependent oxidoreductase